MKTQNEMIEVHQNRRRGFTLVELVIVIAVIAILAGVMIPTFSGIIQKANASAAFVDASNAMTALTPETVDHPDADFLIFVKRDKTIYLFGFSHTSREVQAYSANDGKFDDVESGDYDAQIESILVKLTNNLQIASTGEPTASAWNHPDNIKSLLEKNGISAGTVRVFASYQINASFFGVEAGT